MAMKRDEEALANLAGDVEKMKRRPAMQLLEKVRTVGSLASGDERQ